jgi:ATP-dependent Clp protease ATP-binding subunit ClpX
VPSREDVAKVVITAETVLEHVYPTLVPRTEIEPPQEKSA